MSPVLIDDIAATSPISDSLKRRSIIGLPPVGGLEHDRNYRAAILRRYIPGLQDTTPPPLTPISFDLAALRIKLMSLPGIRFLMGTDPGDIWPDLITAYGDPGDMSPANGAIFNGTYATFDGIEDYFTTVGVPDSQTDFAAAAPAISWRTSGITVGCLMRVQPGDLGNRTLVHWFNGGPAGTDYCRWMLRFWEASGGEELADGSLAVAGGVYLQFWNAYGITGGLPPGDDDPPYLDPVAGLIGGEPGDGTQAKPKVVDRFFTIPVNLNPFLADGRWHFFQFARGTDGIGDAPPEGKLLCIDGVQRYLNITGNGVNGFTDFTVPITIGKTEPTTIVSDAAIPWANFKGDIAMPWTANRWTDLAEMQKNNAAATGGGGRLGRLTRLGRIAR